MLHFRPLAFLTLCCIWLAACVTTPLFTYSKPLDYSTLPTFSLDVFDSNLVNDSKPTEDTDMFARSQGDTPERELERWLAARVKPTGKSGSFTMVIRDANFVRKPLSQSTGWKAWVTRDQSEEWHAYLDVLLSVDGGSQSQFPAEVTIKVYSSHTVPEHALDTEQSRIYDRMLNELMVAFNAEAEKQIPDYFRAYLTR